MAARSVLGAVERVAWRVPLSSRRFFLVLAPAVAGAVVLTSLAAAVVSARNADMVAGARDRGLRIASSVTAFRDHLSAADAEVATTLVSGEPESPLGRSRYESELLESGLALTDAGLVATGGNAEDIAALAEGLVRYADLVETSRAYPVGSTFVDLARALARDDLVPTAERVRRDAEQQIAKAADRVGGPTSTVAIAALTVALVALVASAVLVAGRTRRLTHPALVAAAIVLTADLVVVTAGLGPQSRELRAAASTEIDAYVADATTAFALFDLRVDEMDAVASHGDGDPLYAQFHRDADILVGRLDDDSADGGALLPSLQAYIEGAAEVETLDGGGDNSAAADATLDGSSAIGYREARGIATNTVDRSATDLTERLDAAADADVEPLVPMGLGIVAASLAAAGVLARGRRYR